MPLVTSFLFLRIELNIAPFWRSRHCEVEVVNVQIRVGLSVKVRSQLRPGLEFPAVGIHDEDIPLAWGAKSLFFNLSFPTKR